MKRKILYFLLGIMGILLLGCLCSILLRLSDLGEMGLKECVTEPTNVTAQTILSTEALIDTDALVAEVAAAQTDTDEDFLYWFADRFGVELLSQFAERISQSGYCRDDWYELTGNTYLVLMDLYTGAAEKYSNVRLLSTGTPGVENKTTTLVFGGDICFADNYYPMEYMVSTGSAIDQCIDPVLVQIMTEADITFMNNEFTISDRGEPMKGKRYTFRAATANTALYNTLGVDIVSLANNHAFDYGEDAFLDTLDALQTYGVAQIGGGKNLSEAMAPQYYIVNGRKIAFVAATRAEKNKMTPQATETSAGVLRCYDTELFLQVIAEAEENSDFVIACVHWGTEYSYKLETVQISTARDYIDAGADLIIGGHAHQLQGIDFYNGKAIFYNLGNFWFNNKSIDTGLVRAELKADGEISYAFIPAWQKDCITTSQIGTERGRQILDTLRKYSGNICIDDNGIVTEEE